MKKLLYLATAFLLLWGCDKNQDQALPVEKEELEDNTVVEIGELPEILYVSMAGEQDEAETRTFIENGKVLWQNGDAISYFAANTHNAKYSYLGEDGEASVELTKDEKIVGTTGAVLLKSQAVYPYNENITVEYDAEAGVDKINIVYPTTMKYGTSSFGKDANIMVAAGTHNSDENLHFRNVCGYLVIKLYGVGTNGIATSIKNITLSSVSGVDMIAGSAVVVANAEEAPVITMVDGEATSVTLDCSNEGAGVALGADAEHATEFWFCLPPVTFTDGIKITVTDVYDNSYTKQTTKTVNIERNHVQPMAALEFRSNAPAATKLWYTRSDGSTEALKFYDGKTNPFNANITKHAWDPAIGKIVIEFDAPVTTIQKEAFRGTKIATIELPEGVTTIEEGAFEKSNLTAITFPGSMTNIQVNAFYDCDKIESVTFLPSVTNTPLNICNMSYGSEWGPFYDSKLTYINLNRELVYVNKKGGNFTPDEDDEGLFYHENYDEVESVTVILGPQVKSVLHRMFNYLPIESLTIPGSVTFIDNDAFAGCNKITSVVFEEGIEPLTMGYNTLGDHDGPFVDAPLESVVLNREINYTFSNPDTAYEGLFGAKPTLTSVTLGDQVKTLSPYMFANAAITAIDLNKVESIGNNVFANNTGITSLTIPGSVKSIGNNVFMGCASLANVVFESSLDGSSLTMGYYDSTDDDGPFYSCPLASVNLDREINYTFSNPNADNEGLFGGKKSLVSVTLGNQVKTLSNNMFADALITEIVIPGSVNTIGNDVFHQCTNLTKVTFEPSTSGTPLTIGYDTDGENENLFQDYSPLETLVLDRQLVQTQTGVDTNSEGLFGGISTLVNVTLGNQVTTMPKFMFAGCSSLAELVIPGSVNTIENDVFHQCTSLTKITFEPSPSATDLTIGYDTDGENENLFQDNNCLTTLVLDRELKYSYSDGNIDSASEGAFGGMSTLTNVTLGDQVKTLLPYMFAETGVTSIDLNKVETINRYAFAGTGITSLTIPGYMMTIGNDVFNGCTALHTVKFEHNDNGTPISVGYHSGLGNGLFCNSPLTTVYLDRDVTHSNSDGYNRASNGLFGDKPTLENITIGEHVTYLPPYVFAKAGVKPNNYGECRLKFTNVATIGKGAFLGCGYTHLEISPCVTFIDNHAFANCENLIEVNIPNCEEPVTIGYQPGSDEHGPFWQSPLKYIWLAREVLMSEAYAKACDQSDEGIFANEHSADAELNFMGVDIEGNIKTILPFMFSGLPMASINIPANVTEICNDAFAECKKLTTIQFASGDKPLTVGYNTVADDDGPFVNSPLETIVLDREINYTFPLSYLDTADEGLFGAKPTLTSVTLGSKVKTLSNFMFAEAGITTITIPGTLTEVCNDAFADCSKLTSLVFEQGAQPLTMGYNTVGDDDGPFVDSPLKSIVLNRVIDYTFPGPDSANEGLFGGKSALTSVTLGDDVKTLLPYMFAKAGFATLNLNKVETIGSYALTNSAITNITIPATMTEICNHAFNGCSSLSSLVFESSATPLTMGFQLGGAADHGPFFQSPLSYIKLDREIELNDSYKQYGDESDEGIFSNEHYSDDDLGVTKLVLGSNVKTIHPYMFARTRVQQLHLPETVETIGKNVIEDNEVINAIVFYDEKERPDVADGAFGADSNWLLAGLIPGNYQYYIFVPRYRGRLSSPENELYYTTDDLMNNTYWDALHRIVVDDQPKQSYPQAHKVDGRDHEFRYLDVAGYEWYKQRYYNGVTITPPTE